MKPFILNWFDTFFHVLGTTDAQKTIREISAGISMRGYNLWILICSAMLASIGLDTNSTAVIIGAMLISPLMSPILGVGLGTGINDRDMLFRSFRNLAIATVASLATSTVYFLASPLSEITSELMARTQPTLLDVLIALFGGVAGIIAGSRTERTNAIPGVAIATALMPPVCTAGFGLAHADWKIFGGAFYLFSINAVFISLATFAVVKYLQFPLKEYLDDRIRKQVRNGIYFALLITVLPSMYFLYSVYVRNREKKTIMTQVVNEVIKQGNEVIKWDINYDRKPHRLKIYYSGQKIENEQIDIFKKLLAANGLPEYDLQLFRMNLTREEISEMSNEAIQNLVKTLSIIPNSDSLMSRNLQLVKELQAFYPQIQQIGISNVVLQGTKTDTLLQVLMRTADPKFTSTDLNKLNEFLKPRLNKDTLLLQTFR
ncbi:MAG: DUF389 domain-containing protein [Spirosomataceae bacterium]